MNVLPDCSNPLSYHIYFTPERNEHLSCGMHGLKKQPPYYVFVFASSEAISENCLRDTRSASSDRLGKAFR